MRGDRAPEAQRLAPNGEMIEVSGTRTEVRWGG